MGPDCPAQGDPAAHWDTMYWEKRFASYHTTKNFSPSVRGSGYARAVWGGMQCLHFGGYKCPHVFEKMPSPACGGGLGRESFALFFQTILIATPSPQPSPRRGEGALDCGLVSHNLWLLHAQSLDAGRSYAEFLSWRAQQSNPEKPSWERPDGHAASGGEPSCVLFLLIK